MKFLEYCIIGYIAILTILSCVGYVENHQIICGEFKQDLYNKREKFLVATINACEKAYPDNGPYCIFHTMKISEQLARENNEFLKKKGCTQ